MKSFLKNKSVGTGMVHLLDDFCNANGLIPPAHNKYNYDERIHFDDWLKKINHVDKQYRQEGIGLEIGSMVQPAHIGISAYLANSTETLEYCLKISSKYKNTWYNYMPQKVHYLENDLSLSWDKPAYYQAGLFQKETVISEEMYVAILYTRLQQLTKNPQITFSHINLATPTPRNIEKYQRFFKCSITFETEQTALFISNEILNTPIKTNDLILLNILKDQADNLLNQIPQEDIFLDKVKQKILQSINTKNTNIKYVAQQLNMSTRTLQKKLKDYDLSFQKLLIDVRFSFAKQLLQNLDLRLSDVACLLAYDEQTSFNKAFKLWSGLNPSQWRTKYMHKNLQ